MKWIITSCLLLLTGCSGNIENGETIEAAITKVGKCRIAVAPNIWRPLPAKFAAFVAKIEGCEE